MRSLYAKKWFKIPYLVTLYLFAAYGAFLTLTYLAMSFKLTNDSGMVDVNNRYFQSMHDKYNQDFKVDSVSIEKHRYDILERIILLNDFYPVNAQYILRAYQQSQNEKLALQMIDAVELKLIGNKAYQSRLTQLKSKTRDNSEQVTGLSAFGWMNITEWKHFKEAVIRDKPYIDSAAKVCGVEARVIVSCLMGEQVRMFNSRRERFKHLAKPLGRLALETNQSYGVTGIKEHTAKNIEFHLTHPESEYYLGKDYEHILDYNDGHSWGNNLNDSMSVRVKRLVQTKNHYYSYLYAGAFVHQIKRQWERAGYPIDDRPEILASLFNLGYTKSKPKKNPAVGGANFRVRDTEYTFGAIAFEFYFSGELAEYFPFEKERFKPSKEYRKA